MATINHKKYDEATETFKDFYVYDGKETLIFKVDGEAGNVGIGTASPTSYYANRLVVSAVGENGITIANPATTGSNYLMFADGTTGNERYRGFVEYAHTGDYMALATSSAEKMRITSTGNVGIGTSDPESSRLLVRGSTSDSTSNIIQASNSAGATRFIVRADGQTIFYGSDNGEKVRIAETGNVGIGTTSPNRALEISSFISGAPTGSGFVGGALRLSNTTEYESNYGSGGGNPDFLGSIEFYSGDTSTGTGVRAAIKTSIDAYYNDNSLNFYTAPSNGEGIVERMRILSNGNVGIGTSSPTSLLNLSAATPILTLNQTTINSEQGIEFDYSDNNYAYIRANALTGLVSYAAGLTGGAGYFHRFIVDGSEKLRITPDGLTFNGDTAAANALDDYEEGTWTANLLGSITNPTTATSTTGTYTKIGRQVTLNFRFENKDLAGCTGGLYVAGCPFTSGGGSTFTGSLSTYNVNFNGLTSESLHLPSGGTDIYLYTSGSNSGWIAMTSSDTVYIQGTITYFV